MELIGYFCAMTQTLEKRVEKLEHKLAELTTHFVGRQPRKKDWKRTFGLSRGDDGFREMMSLGRQYRQGAGGPEQNSPALAARMVSLFQNEHA